MHKFCMCISFIVSSYTTKFLYGIKLSCCCDVFNSAEFSNPNNEKILNFVIMYNYCAHNNRHKLIS